MGYDFSIGNAEVVLEDPRRWNGTQYESYLTVPHIAHWNAPSFPNAVFTNRANWMPRSYSFFGEFCNLTGLGEILDQHAGGDMRHPDAILITPRLISLVAGLRFKWEHNRPEKKPPGYSKDVFDPNTKQSVEVDAGLYDHILADLLWFEGWLNWAYRNCPYPCFKNS